MNDFRKKIFLTFDDGPSFPFTLQILDILKELKVKATFFVCGKNAKEYPEMVQRIVKEGHKIGNHTYSHSFFRSLTGLLIEEIERTTEIIYQITKVKTRLFRPPWGILHFWVKKFIEKNGYRIILWDVNPSDWLQPPARVIEERILKKVKNNSIILLHDGNHGKKNCDRSQTVLALPSIIKNLRERGYDFEIF
jgi:chitin deacetylase